MVRSSKAGGHSIEQVFANHQAYLDDDVITEIVEIPEGIAGFLKLLSLWRYSLIHVSGHINWAVTCLFWCPSILTIHDLGRYHQLKNSRRLIYYAWWLLLPTLFARRITVVSEYTRDILIRACPFARHKIEVLYNGIPSGFRFAPRRTGQEKRILQVGTAIHKNPETTIRAMGKVDAKLVLIGRRRGELERLLDEYNVAHEWLTDVPYAEVQRQYEECDVVVFPSFHEGFGLPIIEAQAIGRPVIVSPLCSLPEIGGEGAVYVNPSDQDALADCINGLLQDTDKWLQCVKLGTKNVARFEPERLASQLNQIYSECMSAA